MWYLASIAGIHDRSIPNWNMCESPKSNRAMATTERTKQATGDEQGDAFLGGLRRLGGEQQQEHAHQWQEHDEG